MNRRDGHLSLLWSEADSDETYASYDTLGLCFPDTKTSKSKTTATITAGNVDCGHYTVREEVKSYMKSI